MNRLREKANRTGDNRRQRFANVDAKISPIKAIIIIDKKYDKSVRNNKPESFYNLAMILNMIKLYLFVLKLKVKSESKCT
jgi:hypothetical protein